LYRNNYINKFADVKESSDLFLGEYTEQQPCPHVCRFMQFPDYL